jgi:hypothetical protein
MLEEYITRHEKPDARRSLARVFMRVQCSGLFGLDFVQLGQLGHAFPGRIDLL